MKNPCQQQCVFSVAPCQRSYACPIAQRLQTTVFQANRIDGICPENPCQQLYFSVHRVLPTELSPSYFPRFPFRPPCRHSRIAPSHRSSPQAISHGFASYLHGFLSVQHAVSLPPSEALPKLFARFPVRPACCLAPSQRSSPQAICTVSSPSSMLSRSLPAKLSASYLHGFLSVQHAVSLPPSEDFRKLFARFPVRPACCLAPSQRSFPQAISTVSSPSSKLFPRFPVRPACCLAPSQRSFPQAISTASCPSSMLPRSLPAKLSASYLHGFLSVQHAVSLPPSEAPPKLFPRLPVRPACCLAPSQRTFPQAICTVSSPSSMLSRSLPAKLSASYLHGFQSVQHAVSLPPSEAFRKLFARFRLRSACCLAPSQRSSPQAICTVSSPSSMLSRSLPAKLSASYFHGFLSVQHAVSLPPSEAPPKLFPRLPVRPACCLAPSQRSFPQAICTVSSPSSMLSRSPQRSFPQAICTASSPSSMLSRFPQTICTVSSPSSMLSRSLPAKLSASYFHGFLSVQHAVSLPPGEALRELFPRFPLRPACCLAPSQRSSPQAICTVSSPSSMLSRSLPAKLSPSYFHGFLSVQHAVSLPPSEAFRKLFARFPLRPPCCLASFPAKLSPSYFHGFLSVQHAVSLPPSEDFRKLFARFPVRPACCLAPSLPAKLSPSYFHGFLSVQHAVSFPSSEALRKLFPRFPLRPACCLAPSSEAVDRKLFASSMLFRSLPAKLSASYFHGFLSVQHAVSLPHSEAFRKLFARFPLRPACCLAPSQRRFPQAICTVSSPSSMLSRSLPAKLSPHISTVSCPSSMLSRSLPAKLSASYLHGFLSVQHVVSLPPGEALRKLFARFPIRPACCLAPSQRSFPQAICTVSSPSSMLSRFPQAICTVSSPSSMLSRSLPAKLSPSYLHGFLSVQHTVSLPPSETLPKLPPSEALRKLFARFPLRPACCLAPSRRSSPQAICTVSCPSSMLSRSLPAKLSASYFHVFLSVQHAVSLPLSEAFRKLFPRFPVRPACCLAPSQRSSPQAISTVSCPSSMLSRSLPAKLSASYLHGFLSVQHAVSLPPSEALPNPQAICTVSSPSSMLSRSLPAKLSASYLHLPFLPPFLPSSLPSSLPSLPLPPFLPSFLPSFLLFPFLPPSLPPCLLPSLPPSLPPFLPSFLPPFLPSHLRPISVQHSVSLPRDKVPKREPKHRRCFWEKSNIVNLSVEVVCLVFRFKRTQKRAKNREDEEPHPRLDIVILCLHVLYKSLVSFCAASAQLHFPQILQSTLLLPKNALE